MQIIATSQEQVASALAQAAQAGTKVSSLDLRALNRIVEYTPEDLTVTVEAGMPLAQLQSHLAERRQWLPIDPPRPAEVSIWDLLKFNLSGPRRYGYGTIREHLIGLKVALTDGRSIRSGGKVVKNVAGYDLLKLFVGDRGTLGVAVEATFKVHPLPEAERFVQVTCGSLAEAGRIIEAVIESPLTPRVLDLQRDNGLRVVLGFAGTADEIHWLLAEAAKLGVQDAADLRYDDEFRSQAQVQQISVLPSRLIETLERLQPAKIVSRAGNGVIYYPAAAPSPDRITLEGRVSTSPHSALLSEGRVTTSPAHAQELMRRIKNTFDPKQVLPLL